MKVLIDRSRCTGHARCNSVTPDLYELDDEGFVAGEGFDVALGEEKRAYNGARACPERAIITEGYPDGKDWPAAGQ